VKNAVSTRLIVNRYIAKNIRKIRDTARCCMVSVVMNKLRCYSHLWQTLLRWNCVQ